VCAEEVREWSDSTGKFKIKGKLIGVTGNKITLERPDGKQLEIEVKKLSAADQKYVADQKTMEEDDPFKPKKPMPKNKANGVTEPMLAEVETSDGRTISMIPTLTKWEFTPEKAAEPIKVPNRVVAVPPTKDFFDKSKGLNLSPNGKYAAIGYMTGRSGQPNASSRVLLFDLENSKRVAEATVGNTQMSLMAVNDQGEVLMRREEFGFGKNDRLELWTLNGDEVTRSGAFFPYGEAQNGNRDVFWAAFIDSKKLLTMSAAGDLAAWELAGEKIKLLYNLETKTKATPSISPNRKHLAFATHKELGILDLATGDVLSMVAKLDSPWPSVNFSPEGKRIAVVSGNKLLIYDFATGDQQREIDLQFPLHNAAPVWTSEEQVLLGSQYLVDVGSQVRMWQYTGAEFAQCANGVTWFTISEGNRGTGAIVPLVVPQPAAVAVLEKAKMDPNFYVLKAGSTIHIDVTAITDEEAAEKVRRSLKKRFEAMGLKINSDSDVTVVADVKKGEVREISYRSFGPGGARTYKVQEYFSSLKYVYQNQPILTLSAGNVPGLLSLKQGETIESHLKALEKPNYAYFDGVELPKLLTKSGYNALGVSKVTSAGLR